jgi:hypothetical protein
MTNDLPDEAYLIEVLVLWYRSESSYLPVEGYPRECPSTAGYRASRQHDDLNGAQETDARGRLIARVGAVVNGFDDPYRAALYTLARNRATGSGVWRSARLPDDDMARAEITAKALDLFAVML